MKNYSLNTLLKITEHKKEAAERQLQEAIHHHFAEQNKLSHLENRLRDTMVARAHRQNNFFLKAQMSPSNKTEVVCQVLSNQKTIGDENDLKKSLSDQKEIVKCAYLKLEIAKNAAVDAYKSLKVVENHFSTWKRQTERAEEIREEYITDDQNGVRFLLKKA